MKRLSFFAALACAALFLASCRIDLLVSGHPSGYSASPAPSASPPASPSASPSPSPSPGASPWAALPDVAGITILSVSTDANFAANRAFELRVLPVDSAGDPLLDAKLGFAAEAVNDAAADPVALTLALPPTLVAGSVSALPYAVVIDLDSSGSMSTADPARARVSAAKAMVRALLDFRPSSLITIADFGSGATAPLSASRLLSGWSADRAVLDAAIDQVGASGGTPLYESVDELLRFLDPAMPSSDYQRMMFVLSDGVPTTTGLRDTVYADAGTRGIPVHAVSLGDGAVAATMADLATRTGGIHAAVADAGALMDSFKALVVAREKGYLKISGTFPTGGLPAASAILKLTVKSGAASKSASITLAR